MKQAVFWFRRDLRVEDNHGLFKALTENDKVFPLFIFDETIIDELEEDDHRLTFIYETLEHLNQTLGGQQLIRYYKGDPETIFKALFEEIKIDALYTNADYEPYARLRDKKIYDLCTAKGITFHRPKDHVIFERDEIVKDDHSPYVVFTPYKRRWLNCFNPEQHCATYNTSAFLNRLAPLAFTSYQVSHLEDFNKKVALLKAPQYNLSSQRIEAYEATRNFMDADGTSKLGTYLRFGTVSTRAVVQSAFKAKNHTFLSELIWREFFQQILWHFPKTVSQSFKAPYDQIKWSNSRDDFEKWCSGNTGYPLVDAGMRELNQTGYMHNRVRMLTASFLCKHLLIDWRWGEAYFAKKLFDFELASNVGNWQWAAGSGVDAAPYFRIFNPTTQIQKFDKQLKYINKWVPEHHELTYPSPMVDHKMARERCLATYNAALKPNS